MTDQMIDRTDFFKQLAMFVAEDMQERQRDSHDMTDLMLALARFEDGRALAPRKKLNADGIIRDLKDVRRLGRPVGFQAVDPVKTVGAALDRAVPKAVHELEDYIEQRLTEARDYAYYSTEITENAEADFLQDIANRYERKRPAAPDDMAYMIAARKAVEHHQQARISGGNTGHRVSASSETILAVKRASKEAAQTPLSILMTLESGPHLVSLPGVQRFCQSLDGGLLNLLITRHDTGLAGTITATESKMPVTALQKFIAKAETEARASGDQIVQPKHLFLVLLTEEPIRQEIMKLNQSVRRITISDIQQAFSSDPNEGRQATSPAAFERTVDALRPVLEQDGPKATSQAMQTLLRKNPELQDGLRELGFTDWRFKRWQQIADGNTNTADLEPIQIAEDDFKQAIKQFTRDITAMARAGKLDPIIGREGELQQMKTIMTNRKKKNPIVLGEPGVGKTALLHGYAQDVVAGNVPGNQVDAQVLELDPAALVAGTKYRGDFEQRLKTILQGVAERNARGDRPPIILGIDEAHTLVGLGSTRDGAQDASQFLKTYLQEGNLWTVMFTTEDEYAKHIEPDGALVRRTQTLKVNEPSLDDTIVILDGLKAKFEQHYEAEIPDEIIRDVVRLTDRYVKQRHFPDKAIDALEGAGSAAVRDGKMVVDHQAVVETVARMARLPQSFLGQEDDERYAELDTTLKQDVFGQDQAVNQVAMAMAVAKAGLREPNKPIGSYLFVGPTGVGKTELSRALAKHTAGDADRMVRLDMSEFMEKHSVNRLIGAPPGYVGFDQEGTLTGPVRRTPNTIVLLDEIEKAHPDVLNILLQVMDNGQLTDGHGRVVDFRNTLLVMTSNLGAAEANMAEKKEKIGFGPKEKVDRTAIMERAVEGHFTPEFRNRLDAVVPFYSLSKQVMRPILDHNIARLEGQLRDNWRVGMELGEEARGKLMDAGFNEEMGARPLKRALRQMVEEPLALWMLRNKELRNRPGATLMIEDIGTEFRVSMKAPEMQQRQPAGAENAAFPRQTLDRLRLRRSANSAMPNGQEPEQRRPGMAP